MTRKKRDLYQIKNKMLLDDFRTERCGLEMMRCDGVSSSINYHKNRCRLLDMESSLVQPMEMFLNTHLEKYNLRLTGYPKTLLDNLHERPDNEVRRKSAARIWRFQRQTAAIIGGEKCETKPVQPPSSLLEMLNFLHLGETIFSRDFNRVEDSKSFLDMFFMACIDILGELYDWEDAYDTKSASCSILPFPSVGKETDASAGQASVGTPDNDIDQGNSFVEGCQNPDHDRLLLPIILCQCMRTLRCILMVDIGFIQSRQISSDDIHKFNILLAENLVKWLMEMCVERHRPNLNKHRKASLLTGHVSYFSSLVADTLMCTKCAMQIMVHDSGVVDLIEGIGMKYSTAVQQLIQAVEPLILCSLQEVSNHLTNERRVCKGDMKCMESLYSEAQCGLSVLAACFNSGWVSAKLLELLVVAKQLAADMRNNLGIQSSFLQVLLAGVLFINLSTTKLETDEEYAARVKQAQIDKLQGKVESILDGGAGQTVLRQKLCAFLASCIMDILKAMEVFVTTPSLLHIGLMSTRLLLRLPYMNKKELDTFVEGEQANEMRSAEDIKAERLLKIQEEHNLENLEDDDDISVEDIYIWKEKNLDDDDTFINDWKGEVSMPIAKLLYVIGERNIQSLEVIEQWLLLVRHLCLSSPLALMSLVEAHIEDSVEKVLTIQNHDIYTVALGRICLSELAKLNPDA